MKKIVFVLIIALLMFQITVADINYTEYGKIALPNDFPKTLSFDIFKDRDGSLKHSFDFSTLHYNTKIYIDSHNGSNTNSGLYTTVPVKHLDVALSKAEAIPGDVEIVFLEKWVLSNLTSNNLTDQMFNINKNITFSSINPGGSFITSGNHAGVYAWTNDGGAYKANRTRVQQIADYRYKDYLGLPKLYQKVNTLAECQSKVGTWYTDNVSVWVHTIDNSVPNNNIGLVFTQDIDIKFTMYGYKLAFDNIHFWVSPVTDISDGVNIGGISTSSFYAKNCSFRFASKNGFAFSNANDCYLFNCYADLNGYDGFNYHGQGDEFIFEYNCYSNNNGWNVGGNGNSTSAHDGMTVLRTGSIGHDSNGPVLADVNGCYTINIGCTMYNSIRDAGTTKAAFYVDEVAAAKEGKAYFIDCYGGGTDTYSINSDGNVDIYLKNFAGENIPPTLIYNILN